MITSFSRPLCRALSKEIETVLEDLGTKYGIQIVNKGGSFTPSNYTLKLECAVIGSSGVAETKERTDYLNQCHRFGLERDWLDKSFSTMNGNYTIIGLSPRRHKRPVLCRRDYDGKNYVFAPHQVRAAMPNAVTPPVTKTPPKWRALIN